MVVRLFLISFVFMSCVNVQANTFLVQDKVGLTGGNDQWGVSEMISSVRNGEIVCGEIKELRHAFLCVSETKQLMNETFTRMGFYWGSAKGVPAGTLIPNSNQILKQFHSIVTGHNLPGDIIANFLHQAKLENPESDLYLNLSESSFASSFILDDRVKALNNKYYLIAVSSENLQSSLSTINHELHHARYHLESSVRFVVEEFWKNYMSEADKTVVRSILGQVYNAENEYLIIDEFQAYLLQKGAEAGPMSQFVPRYRLPLLQSLQQSSNYKPLELNYLDGKIEIPKHLH